MTNKEFQEYLHESVHELIKLNEKYSQKFKIDDYERWDYDLEKATLTFSHKGTPYVVADVQAAGTFSKKSKTWMWSWNNESLPDHITDTVLTVREFGRKHKILNLTEAHWDATEDDGWEMSAIANRIIGGKGVYRCPDENGCLFLILTNIRLVKR